MSRRDEQLRKSILDAARMMGNKSPARWVSGSKLAITARDEFNSGCSTDEQAASLIADLTRLELLEEKDPEPVNSIGARELRHRQFRLTDLGFALWSGRIDPIPGVADRRSE